MRYSWILLAIVCAAGLLPAPTRAKQNAQSTLELVISGTFEATLVNGGRRPAVAVLPSDGSDAGWREPHITWRAEQQVAGRWEPLPPVRLWRCGLYDTEWADEIVELAPGERRRLEWVQDPRSQFAPRPQGPVRVRLEYVYTGTPHPRMAGVVPFTLVSNAVVVPPERFTAGR